jgi:hypothetical protein
MRFINPAKQAENNLISPEKYKSLFNDGKLIGRKVLKSLVWKEPVKTEEKMTNVESKLGLETPRKDQSSLPPLGDKSQLLSKESLIEIDMQESRTKLIIQMESSFIKDYLTIKTFFHTPSFRKICGAVGS